MGAAHLFPRRQTYAAEVGGPDMEPLIREGFVDVDSAREWADAVLASQPVYQWATVSQGWPPYTELWRSSGLVHWEEVD